MDYTDFHRVILHAYVLSAVQVQLLLWKWDAFASHFHYLNPDLEQCIEGSPYVLLLSMSSVHHSSTFLCTLQSILTFDK